MTLQQLRYIVMVAECGSITEAAERLFIAQPSLTSAIRSIEEEMGVTAFIRSNKGVELTRDGEVLLSYARQVLEQSDLMMEHSEAAFFGIVPALFLCCQCVCGRDPGVRCGFLQFHAAGDADL